MEPVRINSLKTPAEIAQVVVPRWASSDTANGAADWVKYGEGKNAGELGAVFHGLQQEATYCESRAVKAETQAKHLETSSTNFQILLRKTEDKLMHRNYALALGGVLSVMAVISAALLGARVKSASPTT